MNREQRRRYNKQNKTNFSKAEFDAFALYQQMQKGQVSFNNMDMNNPLITFDSEELAPEGIEVKLDTERILSRKEYETTDIFKNWVIEHKEDIFHLTRETANNSLVALKEDVEEWKNNPNEEKRQPWLFTIFADLLFLDKEENWVPLAKITDKQEDNNILVTNN